MGDSISAHVFKSEILRSLIGEAIDFFTKTPISIFPPNLSFEGNGVYALYYTGNFELYRSLALSSIQDDSLPIYIGKAVPPGWRTARITSTTGQSLFRRIREHHRNIEQVSNLSTSDFKCRYMVLDLDESGIIGPVEAGLIRKFQPLWNTVLDGFGNHTPGEGRFNQARSGWDVVHPGRAWAERCMGTPPDYDDLKKRIQSYARLREKT